MPDEDAYLTDHTDHGRSRAHSGAPGGSHSGHGTGVPLCASACSRVRRTGGTRGGSRTAPTRCMATALMAAMITRCQTLRQNNRHYLQPANANRVEPKPVVEMPGSAAGCPGRNYLTPRATRRVAHSVRRAHCGRVGLCGTEVHGGVRATHRVAPTLPAGAQVRMNHARFHVV